MATITNNAAGMRGINLRGGSTLWVDVGQTVEYDPSLVLGTVPDMSGPGPDLGADLQSRLDAADKRIEELEAEKGAWLSKQGGDEIPALAGKSKAELLDIAKAEGVTVADGANVEAIKTAIEAKRNAG